MEELSTNATRVLETLPSVGAANRAALARKLQLTAEDVSAAVEELKRNELVTCSGKRVCRAEDSSLCCTDNSRLSTEAEALLTALPQDGSTVSNLRLRSLLPFDDATYARAKAELLAVGAARKSVGYGGTLARTQPVPDMPKVSNRLVKREHELYEPFAQWLRRTFEEDEGTQQPFVYVATTATPEGHRRSSGKWSRPDVTAVTVTRYPWLPAATVDVSVYEIKRWADRDKLESVYEAAAQQRWAHFASLVVEMDPDMGFSDPEKAFGDEVILGQVRRFGLGLYTMVRRDGGEFQIRMHLPGTRGKPDDERVNEFLQNFFERHKSEAEKYRLSIK